MNRAGACVMFALLLRASTSAAQSPDHVFVDAGFASAHDEAPRLVLGALQSGASSVMLSLGGGVWLTSRVAAGVEWMKPGQADTTTSGRFGTITMSETEQTITGLLRLRAATFTRGAVDVVGGIGALRASVTGDTLPPGSSTHIITVDDQTLTAWTIGSDLLFKPAAHFHVGADARLYWLRRSPPAALAPGQTPGLIDKSSTRFSLGAFAGATW